MDVFEAIKGRRSIRRFKQDPVPEEYVKKLLEAASWAPTAGNIQPWKFVVVKDPKLIDLIQKFSPGFIGRSPLVIVVCSDRERAYRLGGKLAGQYTAIVDCAMAAQNILLTAYSLGLGSCPIRSFAAAAVKELLEIPEGVEPELIIAIGYPDEAPKPPPRLPLEQISYLDSYGRRLE